MKPGEIVLRRPTLHHNASIDGRKIEVTAIAMHDEPRLNAKHVVLEGYAYPHKRDVWDEYRDGGCCFPYYIDRVIFSGPITIIFWNDNTKTKVRLHQEKGKKKTLDNRVSAIRWAMAKKYYGSRAQLEKRLRSIDRESNKYDDVLVYTMLLTIFDDAKKLNKYVEHAADIAEYYNTDLIQ